MCGTCNVERRTLNVKRSIGDVFLWDFADVVGIVASLKVLDKVVQLARHLVGTVMHLFKLAFLQIFLVPRNDKLSPDLPGRCFCPSEKINEKRAGAAFKALCALTPIL